MARLANIGGGHPELEIYPCNWPAVRLFVRVMRSWRVASVGAGGLTYLGLDYGEVRAVLDLMREPPEAWPELFEDLRVLEAVALKEISLIQKLKSR